MTDEHPNLSLSKHLNLRNLGECSHLFAENFVWHYFNPQLQDLEGDYTGIEGLQAFFDKLGGITGGTFAVEPISSTSYGDELVVTHVRNRLVVSGAPIEVEAIVVWRIVGGQLAEAWDIPAVHTGRPQAPTKAGVERPNDGA